MRLACVLLFRRPTYRADDCQEHTAPDAATGDAGNDTTQICATGIRNSTARERTENLPADAAADKSGYGVDQSPLIKLGYHLTNGIAANGA